MPTYLQKTYSRTSYPERAVTAVAYLKLDKFPEYLRESEHQADLKQALDGEAIKVVRYLSADLLETEVKLREGSLIVEIVIVAEQLSELLSQSFLEDIGLWASKGVEVGGSLYIAHTTFRAIKRLESEIKRVIFQLTGAIKHNLGLTIKDRLNNPTYSEARTGILGTLRRLYEASQVAKGTFDVRRRLPSMKRVANNLTDIEKTVIDTGDRSFLCDLLKGILSEISEESLKGARSSGERLNKEKFNEYLATSRKTLKALCG